MRLLGICSDIHFEKGSVKQMFNQELHWYRQAARKGWKQAKECHWAERHGLACFLARQAAERAVKALHLYLGTKASGSLIAELLKEVSVSVQVPEDLFKKAQMLDACFVPESYPENPSQEALFEPNASHQSERAIQHATEILEFVKRRIPCY
jgi:HEPN domain-containing protein